MNWILASESPRRIELLSSLIKNFKSITADIEEHNPNTGNPVEIVQNNAKKKASFVSDKNPESYVIGADTIISIKDTILSKPLTINEGKAMLRLLSNKTHSVHTGVCVINKSENFFKTCAVESSVTFLALSDSDIDWYTENTTPLDKAGGYAIQEHQERIIKEFTGSYSNIMGLPLEHLKVWLPLNEEQT